MLKTGIVFLISLALLGCDNDSGDAAERPVESAVEGPVESAADNAGAKKMELDLTLPENATPDFTEEGNSLEESAKENDIEKNEERMLPDLFEDSKQEKTASIGGKLLNDPDNPDYLQSIQGAEVTLEIKTD